MVLPAHPKHKVTEHGRKRHGAHHRQTKHYTKTYWPYLTMFSVVLLCGFILNSFWAPARQVLGYATNLSSSQLLQDTNAARMKNGEEPLSMNDKLSQAAQAKANDMAARNYWSHVTPDGNQPWHFAQTSGYTYTAIGENLAYGFDGSSAIINAWMNSPEHRSNVLGHDYREIGFGIVDAAEFQGRGAETIVVAMYGQPGVAAAPIAQNNTGTAAPLRTVTRLETISATHAALITVGTALAAAAAAMYVALKHGIILRRTLIKGEVFIVRHHLLDLILLGIGGIGFVVTRSAGIIH